MAFRLSIGLPVIVLGTALVAPGAFGQGRGMAGRAGARAVGVRAGSGFGHARPRRVFAAPGYFYPGDYGYGYDYDDGYGYQAPEPPEQIVLERPAQPAAAATPVEPLLMEYHDGQWVRIPTAGELPARPAARQPETTQEPSPQANVAGQTAAPQEAPEMPPTMLVFRDGHREEVKKYTIRGNVVYASADYWTTGAWTREIPISSLDVPATLKINADRGQTFSLPSGPNEIVIRF